MAVCGGAGGIGEGASAKGIHRALQGGRCEDGFCHWEKIFAAASERFFDRRDWNAPSRTQKSMKIVYASCGGTWFHYSAAEMLRLGQEAWAYSANKNFTGLPPERFKRSRPFSIACQPFYRLFKGRFAEFGFQAMLPVWTNWLKRQRFPACDVVHSAMSFATEPFDHAERIGALKVLDASNSHPTSFHG